MSNLEFTTGAGRRRVCDNCKNQARIGFWHLHDGTPALFLCYSCAQGMFKPADIEAALNLHKEACFARQENEA